MPNQIIPVVWEKPLRKSAVNTLDKLNEVIDFINTSDIHEFSFIDGDTGREVVSGTSTQLATLDVFGECVQDGTPTPENPVPVQGVEGRNLVNTAWKTWIDNQFVNSGITYTRNADGTITANGTATANSFCFLDDADIHGLVEGLIGKIVHLSGCPAGGSGTKWGIVVANWRDTQVLGDYGSGLTITPTSYTNAQFYLRIASGNTVDNLTFKPMLEAGTQATPYIPYGCIGLQIGETVTPIDLQGHTLAGVSNNVLDELDIDAAGVKRIGQRVGVVDLGTLTWLYQDVQDFMYARIWFDVVPKPASGEHLISEAYYTRAYFTSDSQYLRMFGTGYTDPATFKAAMDGVMLYYELATPQTIELGIMDMPPIPSGSVIKIAASLQPEFGIQWWTESAIPSVINGLKAYVDEQIETVNARIDELHGITRATVVRPDVIAPAIEFEPIEKITVDETETDMEKEN